jgi:hypothetical protein
MAKSKQSHVGKMKVKGTKTSNRRGVITTAHGTSAASSKASNSAVQDLASGDQGGTTNSAEEVEVPPKPLAEFHLFTRLPTEIQQMIFMEAMRKPAVHFTEIKRFVHGEGKWTITMHPVNGSGDTSMYRKLRQLGSVCPAAARAVHFGTEDKHRLPFSARGLKSAGVDTRHDLVHVKLKTQLNGLSSFGPWYPGSFGATDSRLDVAHARALLRGIANICLKLDLRRHTSCFDPTVPFRSLLRISEHKQFSMCPEELSGFLDLFPDLGTVYLLVIPERQQHYKFFFREYTEAVYTRTFQSFLSPPIGLVFTPSRFTVSIQPLPSSIANDVCFPVNSDARESMGLAIFHDSKNAYIQFDSELAASLPLSIGPSNKCGSATGRYLTTLFEDFSKAVKEAMTADRHPTKPIPVRFQSPFTQRSGIKFRGLLEADESMNRIL